MKAARQQLDLPRCPYCNIANPLLAHRTDTKTDAHDGTNERVWRLYACVSCGGVVLVSARPGDFEVIDILPESLSVPQEVPEFAGRFLSQALDTLSSPDASVVVAAASVDAMLKDKGYGGDESLNARIDRAADDHVITKEMAAWAHEIRLDANASRHADEGETPPTQEDARRTVDFALSLAGYLYVLPNRVRRGRKEEGTS